jgi:hypothetical protein
MMTFSTRTLFTSTAIVAAIFALGYPMIQSAQDAAMEIQCCNNAKQIGLAILNYESAYRRLPIAIEISEQGKLWRSWRSHVYPTFIEQTSQPYDGSQAWDSRTNLRLINGTPIASAASKGSGKTVARTYDRVPWCFRCPKCANPAGVNYVVITGEGTPFPDSKSIRLSDITDGLDNTLLVVESVNCTPDWIEPQDLHIATMDFKINSLTKPSISSFHPKGAAVCFADGAAFLITHRITESELKALITIGGGEDITRDDLIKRGILVHR